MFERKVYEKRWRKCASVIRRKNADAYVISELHNLRYMCSAHIYTGALSSHFIIFRNCRTIALVPSLEKNRAEDECTADEMYYWSEHPYLKVDGKNAKVLLKRILSENKVDKVLCDRKVPGIRKVKWEEDESIYEMRMVKDDYEIKQIRKACNITMKCERIIRKIIDEDMSELELTNEINYALLKMGSDGFPFPTIVASGKNSAYPHHVPTNNKIGEGAITCDFGAYYNGYCSDITRTYFIGRKNEKMDEIYEVVKEACERALKKIKKGTNYSDIDLAARDVIKEYGFGEDYIHGTGHGIGLEVHESPKIYSKTKEKVRVGHVFTIEPGIYLKGIGGVRIENDVYFGKNGLNILTK